MGKNIIILLSLSTVVAFSSCGNTNAQDNEITTTASTTTEATTTTTTTTTTVTTTTKPETTTTTTVETSKPMVESKINSEGEDLSSNDTVQTKTQKTVEIDKSDETVMITLRSSLVGDDPQAYIDKIKDDDGVVSAEFNENGDIDIVFTKEKYKKACEDMKLACQESIDKMVESGQYPTISEITYNSDLTDFYVKVPDYEAYSKSMDGFANLAIKIVAETYHMYLQDDAVLYVHLVDQDGNEIDTKEL